MSSDPTRNMSDAQLAYVLKLEQKADRALGFVRERTGSAVNSGVTVALAAVGGYVDGRYPDRKILGLELSLALGLGIAGYAYMQKPGTMEERGAMAAANGLFAGFSYQYARSAGEAARSKAASQPRP